MKYNYILRVSDNKSVRQIQWTF